MNLKNLKRILIIPALLILTCFVWFMWFIIDGATWIMERIESIGDKLFGWAEK
jgi:hypothetical protein